MSIAAKGKSAKGQEVATGDRLFDRELAGPAARAALAGMDGADRGRAFCEFLAGRSR